MRNLFGTAIIVVALFTASSVEPTVGKTQSTISLSPLGMMGTVTDLPQAHYDDYSTIF
jgi:hypothetical protein